MLRATFFVDGFNLYHSLRSAEHDLYINDEDSNTRWLDLTKLFRYYIPIIASRLGTKETPLKVNLEKIFYFSAYARHRELTHPGNTERHEAYINCLKSQGIFTEMGMFKRRDDRWEEKETDVAIAVRLAEQSIRSLCDVAVIVTGDTDIAPAIRLVREMCPHLRIVTLFPYRRKNKELEKLADASVNMTARSYVKYQLSDPYECSDGIKISKPNNW